MPQHIWHEFRGTWICEDCGVRQFNSKGKWEPEVYPICPGDEDDGGRRGPRRQPPSSPTRELELT